MVDLPRDLEVTLGEFSVDDNVLTLEVLETGPVDPEKLIALRRHTRELGVRLALDDYEVGYSIKEMLETVDFDAVKLDRRYTPNTEDEPTALQLEVMLNEVRANGALSVMEVIETSEHLAMARLFGADLMQGFHLGRPGPLSL